MPDEQDGYLPMFLGPQIAAWCIWQQRTGQDLARAVGVHEKTFSHWHTNTWRVFPAWIQPLADAFGITVDELLHREPHEGFRLHLSRLQAHQDLEDYWREVAAA